MEKSSDSTAPVPLSCFTGRAKPSMLNAFSFSLLRTATASCDSGDGTTPGFRDCLPFCDMNFAETHCAACGCQECGFCGCSSGLDGDSSCDDAPAGDDSGAAGSSSGEGGANSAGGSSDGEPGSGNSGSSGGGDDGGPGASVGDAINIDDDDEDEDIVGFLMDVVEAYESEVAGIDHHAMG